MQKSIKKALTIASYGAILTEHFGKSTKKSESKNFRRFEKSS